ncbi:unnamed protein product [Cyprideis torosa]|uniref:Uncharacterized protein n=1 Tax=Cyprideis torosa TaxID=163714 RepID=A0A7R8W573_9CRUS|nr:unnamed protein product [Cyprideis torosa]CAG0884856.1 unnamed protein product [Cyprideis torosa]
MDRKHAVVKRFRCTECDYASVERAAVEKHTRIRHTMERPFVCETCGFRGHTQSTIARHRRSHTKEKPHQCYICYQRFADKKRLGDHLMAHSNLKPYKCPNCTYETRRKDNLKLHIQRNHAPLAEDLARKLEAAAAAVPFHMQQAQQQYKVEPIVSEIVQEGEQVTMLTGHHEDIESSDPLLLPPEEAQEVEIEHQWVE